MLHTAQSRDGQNTFNAIGVTAESELAAVGRPSRAAVARIIGELNCLFASDSGCIDSALAGAITLTECDQSAVRRECGCCLEPVESRQGDDFDLVLRSGSLRIDEGNNRNTNNCQAKRGEYPELRETRVGDRGGFSFPSLGLGGRVFLERIVSTKRSDKPVTAFSDGFDKPWLVSGIAQGFAQTGNRAV